MKKHILYFSLFTFGAIFLLSACTKSSPEPSPSDPRSNFVGSWGVTETSTKNYYTSIISVDQNSTDGVFIGNFGASNVSAHAVVSGNSITITSQQLTNGWGVNGSGSYSQGKITWQYSINDGANQSNYIAVFTKL